MKKVLLSAIVGVIAAVVVATGCLANYFCSSLVLNSTSSNSTVFAVEVECFLVCLNKSQSQLEAETIAGDCLDSGAGYVFKNGGYFFVVHSAYEKQNDAHLVSEHLKKCGIDSEILSLTFPKIFVDEDFSQESQNVLRSSLNSFYGSFRSLCDLAVGLSTQVYSINDVDVKLQKLGQKIESLQKKYDATFQVGSPKLISIGQYLADEVECVMLAKPVERDLNYRAVELVEIYKNMCEELG